jgi:hypothetical protein
LLARVSLGSVLLVMLHGSKRFRVAGRTVGSPVVIDHMMSPGDAIFIPSLSFHSGGSATQQHAPNDSMLLSVALAWPSPSGRQSASAVVDQWKIVRQALVSRMPAGTCDSWAWAATNEGTTAMRTAMAGGSVGQLLERFLYDSSESLSEDEAESCNDVP